MITDQELLQWIKPTVHKTDDSYQVESWVQTSNTDGDIKTYYVRATNERTARHVMEEYFIRINGKWAGQFFIGRVTKEISDEGN